MCREADKTPGCLDTQISTGWWESWDPQSRHFKPLQKIFSVSLDSWHSLFPFGPQSGLSVLYAFLLSKFNCVPLATEVGIYHIHLLPTIAIKKRAVRSLESHQSWILGLKLFIISNPIVSFLSLPWPTHLIFFRYFVLGGSTSRMSLCPISYL